MRGHPLVLHQKGDVVEVARREPGAHVRAEDEPIALVDGAYTWRVSQSHEWVGHIYLKLDANAGGARTRGGYAGGTRSAAILLTQWLAVSATTTLPSRSTATAHGS